MEDIYVNICILSNKLLTFFSLNSKLNRSTMWVVEKKKDMFQVYKIYCTQKDQRKSEIWYEDHIFKVLYTNWNVCHKEI